MVQVHKNDIVFMRDGRIVHVTDAADDHPDAWRTYNFKVGWDENGKAFDEEYIADEMPPETIFVGYVVHPELYEDPNLGEPGYEPAVVVSDMSEVVRILE